jgi:hypothetical protein
MKEIGFPNIKYKANIKFITSVEDPMEFEAEVSIVEAQKMTEGYAERVCAELRKNARKDRNIEVKYKILSLEGIVQK